MAESCRAIPPKVEWPKNLVTSCMFWSACMTHLQLARLESFRRKFEAREDALKLCLPK